MSISTKTGAITGKLVKGTVRAPKATGNWFKTMGQDMSEGYRSVVPKKIKLNDEPVAIEIDDQPIAATEEV